MVINVLVDVDGLVEKFIDGDGFYVIVWCEWIEFVDVVIEEGFFDVLGVFDVFEDL